MSNYIDAQGVADLLSQFDFDGLAVGGDEHRGDGDAEH